MAKNEREGRKGQLGVQLGSRVTLSATPVSSVTGAAKAAYRSTRVAKLKCAQDQLVSPVEMELTISALDFIPLSISNLPFIYNSTR